MLYSPYLAASISGLFKNNLDLSLGEFGVGVCVKYVKVNVKCKSLIFIYNISRFNILNRAHQIL